MSILLEKCSDRNPKHLRNAHEAGSGNTVGAAFVFLELLVSNAEPSS